MLARLDPFMFFQKVILVMRTNPDLVYLTTIRINSFYVINSYSILRSISGASKEGAISHDTLFRVLAPDYVCSETGEYDITFQLEPYSED